MISLELESLIGVTVIVRAGLPPPSGTFYKALKTIAKRVVSTEMWLEKSLGNCWGTSHSVQSREHRLWKHEPIWPFDWVQWIPELWNMGPGCACHIGAIRLAVGWLWHGLFQTPSQCPVLHVPRWHLVGRSWASKAGSLECSPLCFDKHIIDHLITSLRSALRSLGELGF